MNTFTLTDRQAQNLINKLIAAEESLEDMKPETKKLIAEALNYFIEAVYD